MSRISAVLVVGAALVAAACGDARKATEDRNKAVVRQWLEDIDRSPNPVDTVDKWMTPDFKAEINGTPISITEYRELMAGFAKSFSNFKHEVTYMVAEGDTIALGLKSMMTHTGDYEGLAATGRRVAITEAGIVRVHDGKIAEERSVADLSTLDQQLRAPAEGKK
jgi:predicted ester cyclase